MIVIRMLCCLVLVLAIIGSVSVVHADITKKQSGGIHKKDTHSSDSKRPVESLTVSHKDITFNTVIAKTAKLKPDVKKSILNTPSVKKKVEPPKKNFATRVSPSKKTAVSGSRNAVSKTVKSKTIIVSSSVKKKAVSPSIVSKNKYHAQVISSHEPSHMDIHQLHFSSRSVMVYDDASDRVLYARNANDVVPIASITKLMTATVILDAHLPMHTSITITDEDVDMLRHSSSRLPVGAVLPRRELLRLSLMSSENRATHALARTYPGGVQACVAAMNHKARALGMSNTFFADPTGLYSSNRSTAHDLMILVKNSYEYELIQEFTTTPEYKVASNRGCIAFRNTNPLVREGRWDIELSKTGFINEAGLCMVMKANIADRPVIIVLLDANSKEGRLQDANNIKRWIEAGTHHAVTAGYGFRSGERS